MKNWNDSTTVNDEESERTVVDNEKNKRLLMATKNELVLMVGVDGDLKRRRWMLRPASVATRRRKAHGVREGGSAGAGGREEVSVVVKCREGEESVNVKVR